MLKIASLALASILVLGAVADASAYTRSSSTTGPRGNTVGSTGTGSCTGGACVSNQTVTGPRGQSGTRSGTTTCADGKCQGGATYTGPGGNTVKRNRSTTAN
jgi:hypothetical protein